MLKSFTALAVLYLLGLSQAWKYDEKWTKYNLNTNKEAQHPLEYSGEWEGHQYTPSPDNWRFPFYTLFLDRWVNGDPSNDNINGTKFEHDVTSNQMRNGGDLQGLIDSLDYLRGMGIKGIYIAGSPFLNQPWTADSYSPLDLSLLDWHFGDLAKWQETVQEIHARNMYVVLDNTFATLGDLIGFDGYLNETTPFSFDEHKTVWKSERRYADFDITNDYNETCNYPRFWLETGYPVGDDVTSKMKGCYNSELDQYGATEAFGVYPDWRRQLTKFADVQDRLREWHEPTRLKIENFYCMMIGQLDIDGYRYDKAMQSTVDAMGSMNAAMRNCARKYGKENFFLPGEITGGNVAGSIFVGRGRQPDQLPENLTVAATLSNNSDDKYFIRELGQEGLDAGAFHYTTYRSLTRFLGMDGNLEAGYDSPKNWVDQWNNFIMTNDLVNANTGKWDPRHMYGVTNQDVFRWGAIRQGVERQLLGHYVTSILMPGIPLLLWGEEQAFYLLDNTATNYIFGRQPMSAATAWMQHGCYSFEKPSAQYFDWPIDKARTGCQDETQMYDHRDPTHPVRNILRHMYRLRELYPVLNDGLFLQQLSNQTEYVTLPGSSEVATEFGLWSVLRAQFPGVQELATEGGAGDLSVWLLYSNKNDTTDYTFDCKNNDTNLNTTALIAPYETGTTVKNLFYPFDELTLEDSVKSLGINGSTQVNGCASKLTMPPFGFKAYVPKTNWQGPKPMMTKFEPGHDARIEATVDVGSSQEVDIEFQFSEQIDCDAITAAISFNSTTLTGKVPSIKSGSVQCTDIAPSSSLPYIGYIPSQFSYKATLENVEHGVHAITVDDLTSVSGLATDAKERVVFRLGAKTNPVVFPLLANYSEALVTKDSGKLTVHHSAVGATLWRYSTNWGSSFSDWVPLTNTNDTIEEQPWSGTKLQKWNGVHVRVEYYSPLVGQSDIIQQGDISNEYQRRFPHLFWNGPYNQYGYDAGLDNEMKLVNHSTWEHHFMAEWVPQGVSAQINVWGINPDKQPDQSFVFGDIDGDSVLDRLPPSSLSSVSINITKTPPRPYLGWRITLDDGTMKFVVNPSGSMYSQLALYILLWIVPIIGALTAVWLYQKSFYDVKFNQVGVSEKTNIFKLAYVKALGKGYKGVSKDEESSGYFDESGKKSHLLMPIPWKKKSADKFRQTTVDVLKNVKRRTVLIATMEYNISDWNIKIKIGGLGVMAQLMGDNLKHQDLIWVVPCVGGVEYPIDTPAEPMQVVIMGSTYDIQVQYHKVNNITYVLLDAPVFRQQSKAEPYPARMDDMTSAIYYSAYNQAIAHTINRFPIDLYHINDYHGTIAPLYLLPRTIPCCLSLHNAEFQGLWPMRTKEETAEVCSVFNLPVDIAARYVQFGEVFNLLHAGASILREHQNGFGAVGVSKKYGKRAFARYAIFWGLRKVQALPNPDPSDLAPLDKKVPKESDIKVDPEYEAKRGELRVQAQEWAGLNQDPEAELFVFVGRWSLQKGIDLIADVFPAVLEENPKAQLICVGPVIDLYGKFAAAKLDKMMQVYPGRVFSKPEFTALPPFIFSGAEFALIPSRDEPFGLVAVEFGRKGALGVGNRVGGLGQMPGWWATVESNTTSHLTSQFKIAIQDALASDTNTRALMRARSAKQRFPVAQWVEDLEILQNTSIKIHDKIEAAHRSQHTGEQFGLSPNLKSGHNPHDSIISMGTFTPSLGRSQRGISVQQLNDKLNAVIAKDSSKRLSKKPPPPLKGIKSQGLIRSSSKRGPGHYQSETADSKPHTRLPTPRESEDDDGARPRMPFFVGFEASRPGSAHEDSDMETDNESMFDEPENLPPMEGQVGTRRRDIDSPTLHDQVALSRSESMNNFDFALPRAPFAGSGAASPRSPSQNLSPLLAPEPVAMRPAPYTRNSTLSLDGVIGQKTDYNLQKVDPFFTDSTGEYFREFQHRLDGLNAANSDKTCIEEFLVKSEKKWFDHYRDAKLGRSHKNASQLTLDTYHGGPQSPSYAASRRTSISDTKDEFLLGKDYTPPTGLARVMQLRVLGWPVYSLFLAFGQIIAANSYQITLLTGEVGQTAEKLYVIASIYMVTSVGWWYMFRTIPSRWTLSLPFALYGLAFLFIGLAHFAPSYNSRGWVQNLGTAWYACASSSGSIFFATNFGDEGGAPAKVWVFRACIIQGTQQIYVVALWAWGSYLSKRQLAGILASEPVTTSWKITAICVPIAVFLWAVGFIVFFGLPSFYRQHPGTIRSFYTSIGRRKIILWFFVTVLIQNFFLSAPYGRNWSFLFSSTAAPMWVIMCLVVLFFIFVWAGFLGIFAYFSKSHSWLIPLFAIGLGAPRWAQIWWGCSNIGLYLPWAGGSPIVSAVLSRSLWLWLGTLDTIQGVGFGMILLVTLTRTHVAFTLIAAQVLGSIATMVARACAPNNIGPGPISPDISKGIGEIGQAWFWISLILNLGICVGFAVFFRKEQLSKP